MVGDLINIVELTDLTGSLVEHPINNNIRVIIDIVLILDLYI